MAYYTERHGMRKAVEKTYDISLEMYSLLFHCCERYYDNLAWKYPAQCPDGLGCCGIDEEHFSNDLLFEIPTLFRKGNNRIDTPNIHHSMLGGDIRDEYDQYALLDFIEFFANNVHDVIDRGSHSYYGHHHITCQNTWDVRYQFRDEINGIFQKTGLLYKLNDDLQVERIIEDSPLTPAVEEAINSVKESGTRDLLNEAISLHRSPKPENIRDSVEKLWDAFERLKTYYSGMKKQDSAAKIVADMSDGQEEYSKMLNAEFKALTDIGNNYRIRHHETDKIEITDNRYYDYFFNRCLSLIAIAIQYLN